MSDYRGTYTENLSLSKDNEDDSYDVGRVNSNSDKIDEWAGKVNSQLNALANKNVKQFIFSRDITLSGTQKVELDFKPDCIELLCYRHGRNGLGFFRLDVINKKYGAITFREDNAIIGVSSLIYAETGSINISGEVKNISQTGFEVEWVTTGTLSGSGNVTVIGFALKL